MAQLQVKRNVEAGITAAVFREYVLSQQYELTPQEAGFCFGIYIIISFLNPYAMGNNAYDIMANIREAIYA